MTYSKEQYDDDLKGVQELLTNTLNGHLGANEQVEVARLISFIAGDRLDNFKSYSVSQTNITSNGISLCGCDC